MIQKLFSTKLAGFFMVMMMAGCSPGLKTALEPPLLVAADTTKQNWVGTTVSPMVTSDTSAALAVIDGRSVPSAIAVDGGIKRFFEDSLVKAGARRGFGAGVVLNIEVKEWRSTVTPGFPVTKVTTRAEFQVSTTKYRGTYSGVSEYGHVHVTEKDIQNELAKAAQIAVDEFITDEAFPR